MPIDSRETEIIRESGINDESVQKLLAHRISLGIVKYPNAAKYLADSYERLQGRVFKKKNIRKFNRRWYEYIWPRDPKFMFAHPRILTPRLVRKVRFVLDTYGYLSDDGCEVMRPGTDDNPVWAEFETKMRQVMGSDLSKKELLQYCLAFMNGNYAHKRLVTGRRPTPKGSYPITEAYLKEIPIPSPADKKIVKKIIQLVDGMEQKVFTLSGTDQLQEMEAILLGLVDATLGTHLETSH